MKIRSRILSIAALILLHLSASAAALEGGFIVITPDQLQWTPIKDGLGAMMAVVQGDPAKVGEYVVRVRFPPHVMDLAHFHSTDRHVTVLKGVWCAGTGQQFDPAKSTPLKPGSYMLHPANAPHWDGSCTDEEAIVQIIGIGPMVTTQDHGPGTSWVHVN